VNTKQNQLFDDLLTGLCHASRTFPLSSNPVVQQLWGKPMMFIVKRASDFASEETRDISSMAALVALADGLKYELIVSPALLKPHPVILICDRNME
jgi:hypothetical protein